MNMHAAGMVRKAGLYHFAGFIICLIPKHQAVRIIGKPNLSKARQYQPEIRWQLQRLGNKITHLWQLQASIRYDLHLSFPVWQRYRHALRLRIVYAALGLHPFTYFFYIFPHPIPTALRPLLHLPRMLRHCEAAVQTPGSLE